jgi:hypothetical protein
MLPSAHDFKTLPEAIAFYTKKVAEVARNKDRSMHDELLRFKKELHDRIEKEEAEFWLVSAGGGKRQRGRFPACSCVGGKGAWARRIKWRRDLPWSVNGGKRQRCAEGRHKTAGLRKDPARRFKKESRRNRMRGRSAKLPRFFYFLVTTQRFEL